MICQKSKGIIFLLKDKLLYNKGENAENIKWIEENTPLHLVSIEEYLPQNLKNRTGSQGYLQLIPGEDTCDGFFISKFKRPEAK